MMMKIRQMNWKKIIQKGLLWVLAIAAATCLLEFLQISSQPRQSVQHYTLSGERELIFPQEQAELVNCIYEQGQYMPTQYDARVVCRPQKENAVQTVLITFSSAAEKYIDIQVFYVQDGEEFTESCSVRTSAAKGQLNAAVALPAGNYQQIRIDMDDAVPLASIECSEAAAECQTNIVEPVMRASRMCWTALGLGLLALLWQYTQAHKRILAALRRAGSKLKQNPLRAVRKALCFVVVAAASGAVICFVMPHFDFPLTRDTAVFAMAAGTCFAAIVCWRRLTAEKPEYLFLVAALLFGCLMVQFLPSNIGNSWDEEYHFRNALNVSYIDEIRLDSADSYTCSRGRIGTFDAKRQTELDQYLHTLSQNPDMVEYEKGMFSTQDIWAVLSGILMFWGRVLDLPYVIILRLGKLGNLLTYVLAGFFAIRKLKSGKMLLFVLLMGATTVFMASSYSYDPHVVAFSALAFSYFFAEWQEPDKPMRPADAAIMISSMVIASLPKEIYIPFILVFLFMPRKKFSSARMHKLYVAAILLSLAAVVASFALPFLTNMESKSDMRGGSDVNARQQVLYLLSHPFLYIETLVRFLLEYLKPDSMSGCFVFLAYQGGIPNFTAYMLTLAVTAATDKNQYDLPMTKSWKLRLYTLGVLAVMILVIPTCFYITFTPVGLEAINGCQQRYILPFLFPALMMLGSGNIQNRLSRYWYNGIIMVVCSYVAFYGTLTNIIIPGML